MMQVQRGAWNSPACLHQKDPQLFKKAMGFPLRNARMS